MSGEDGRDQDPDLEAEVMAGFRGTSRGVSARFTAAQAGVIRALVGQVADLVSEPPEPGSGLWPEAAGPGLAGPDADLAALLGLGGPDAPPDDPVLARLLPDAYRDDSEAAGEFRRYTEPGLREAKAASAATVLATLPERGGRVRLAGADAQAWLRALNDVRLALGVRLEITDDDAGEGAGLDPGDPRSAYRGVYDWLTYLQETLVRALW